MIQSSTAAFAAAFILVTLAAAPPLKIVATLLAGLGLVGIGAAARDRAARRRQRPAA